MFTECYTYNKLVKADIVRLDIFIRKLHIGDAMGLITVT
jgi:hypothetical protein